MIKVVLAGDKNYKEYVENGSAYAKKAGYETLIYDLGGMGIGKPFTGRFSDEKNAKIPCKPHIILDALDSINDNEYLIWTDADALILTNIDEIKLDYDIAVTVRDLKDKEHDVPINAGVVFVRKTVNSLIFLEKWIKLSDKGKSDQPPLNQLCNVGRRDVNFTVKRDNVRIHVFPGSVYNNSAKKNSLLTKIKHYKSKIRHLYPLETTNG